MLLTRTKPRSPVLETRIWHVGYCYEPSGSCITRVGSMYVFFVTDKCILCGLWAPWAVSCYHSVCDFHGQNLKALPKCGESNLVIRIIGFHV